MSRRDKAQVHPVKLNQREEVLAKAIDWNDPDKASMEKVSELAARLLKREAIPESRLRYFTDPGMNIGGRGKSRIQVFAANGTTGEDIYRHPHFLAYLKYFVFGPDLPAETIQSFCKILNDDLGTTGMMLEDLAGFVRKEVRQKNFDRNQAAEEFFKLCHEVGEAQFAQSVRSAAKQARR